jgi:hypothetical protein
MDQTLIGTLILGVIFMPYVVEVLLQARLQARFLAVLPESTRARLPPHPRRPWLACIGSTRFFFALWRCIRRDLPDDPDPVLALKRKMRASVRRAIVWGLCSVGVFVALLAWGWRPFWP